MSLEADNADSLPTYSVIYLGRDWGLYLGAITDTVPHRRAAAVTLCLGLDGEFQPAGVGPVRAVIAAAGAFVGGTRFAGVSMAMLYLSPEHPSYLPLQRAAMPALATGVENAAEWLELMRLIYREQPPLGSVEERLRTLLPPPVPLDARLAAVMARIHGDPAADAGVDELAAGVGLSGHRLQHLFKEATGTTLRRYRLWKRAVLVGRRLGAGWRLTEAALEAGFTDSSHLSRSFRELFGMAPSDVFSRMRIIVGDGDGAGAPSEAEPDRL
jgi:AraC-like DNA-binding protein